MGETPLKPLKAILEAIREQADFALKQLQQSEDERSMLSGNPFSNVHRKALWFLLFHFNFIAWDFVFRTDDDLLIVGQIVWISR
jgi:hypothetical protein